MNNFEVKMTSFEHRNNFLPILNQTSILNQMKDTLYLLINTYATCIIFFHLDTVQNYYKIANIKLN